MENNGTIKCLDSIQIKNKSIANKFQIECLRKYTTHQHFPFPFTTKSPFHTCTIVEIQHLYSYTRKSEHLIYLISTAALHGCTKMSFSFAGIYNVEIIIDPYFNSYFKSDNF